MKTVGVTEFRSNIKKYLDIASQEKVIIHRGNGISFAIVPVEEIKESHYDPKFVEKILKGREDSKNGKSVSIALDDLWK
jgi:PHD/YefM family antitoxin component YafN of YafNO toxin-antitoxin module